MRIVRSHAWLVLILAGQLSLMGMYISGCARNVPVQTPDSLTVVETATGHIVGSLPFAAAD